MKDQTCHCCGGPLEASQKLICLSCFWLDVDKNEPVETNPQSEWKQEVENDDKASGEIQ